MVQIVPHVQGEYYERHVLSLTSNMGPGLVPIDCKSS